MGVNAGVSATQVRSFTIKGKSVRPKIGVKVARNVIPNVVKSLSFVMVIYDRKRACVRANEIVSLSSPLKIAPKIKNSVVTGNTKGNKITFSVLSQGQFQSFKSKGISVSLNRSRTPILFKKTTFSRKILNPKFLPN